MSALMVERCGGILVLLSNTTLVQAAAAEFRLGTVDVGMVPLRVDERFHRVLRSSAGDEFAISAPPSRMARHPDVDGEASEHSEAAFEIGLLLWIL